MNTHESGNPESGKRQSRPFLGIHFTCCNKYARIYKNASGTSYEGRCPQCRALVTVAVGEGGTSQRFFTAK